MPANLTAKEDCYLCGSQHAPKWKKNITETGFPFADALAPHLASLVNMFHPEARHRIYTPEVVVFSMIAAIFNRDHTLRSIVAHNNVFRATVGLPPSSLNTAAFSDARSRLDVGVLQGAATAIASEINAKIAHSGFWEDFHPYVIDGTTLTANDTPENQQAYPQSGTQVEGVGFPLLRAVVIQSLTTGMIVNCAIGSSKGKGTGEMALARETLPSLEGNVLLLGDRYYPSFFLLAELLSKGWNGVFQAHAARNLDFRRGESLGDRDHVVEWQRPARPEWMTIEEYEQHPSVIKVREMEIQEKKKNKDRVVIVTTLLDEVKFPKTRIAAMYRKRWKVEVALRDLKDTFGLGHVAACTPMMVEKVIWAHMLAYNVLRWHMINASILYETELEEISVTAAATVLSANAALIASCTDATRPKIFASVYEQIIKVPVGRRPGRMEPRALKKRPKPQKYLKEPRSHLHAKLSTLS